MYNNYVHVSVSPAPNSKFLLCICTIDSMNDELRFSVEERPHWRGGKSSLEMLGDITEWMKRRKTLMPCPSLFIEFVHQSNIGEDVGTQTKEETTELLRPIKEPTSLHETETVNTFRALEAIDELSKDMDKTGLITVQQICETHKLLMNGLHHNCGKIRDTNVYTTRPDGEIHNYLPPELIENKLYHVIDCHNYHMEQFRKHSDLSTYDKLVFLIKCAAWLLFHFVDTHPFSDGNGRMCRLLAGYTMMVVTPFPVHPYYVDETNSSTNSRQDYINAIVSCSRHSNKEPSLIAALLVDGLYHGWQTYLKQEPSCTLM